MSKQTKFYDQLINHIKFSINTLAPAKVIKYYESTREADLELLFLSRNKNGAIEKFAIIEKAPVLGMRFKAKKVIPASISGITASEDSINSSNVTITPKEEIEWLPFLKKGDIVFVAFAQRAIDNLQDKAFDPDSHRTHSIKDAVVMGVWNL